MKIDHHGGELGVLGAPQWMVDMLETFSKWREELSNASSNEELVDLPRNQHSVKNPLYRSLQREVTLGRRVLNL